MLLPPNLGGKQYTWLDVDWLYSSYLVITLTRNGREKQGQPAEWQSVPQHTSMHDNWNQAAAALWLSCSSSCPQKPQQKTSWILLYWIPSNPGPGRRMRSPPNSKWIYRWMQLKCRSSWPMAPTHRAHFGGTQLRLTLIELSDRAGARELCDSCTSTGNQVVIAWWIRWIVVWT